MAEALRRQGQAPRGIFLEQSPKVRGRDLRRLMTPKGVGGYIYYFGTLFHVRLLVFLYVGNFVTVFMIIVCPWAST